jgi:hypothetical protein
MILSLAEKKTASVVGVCVTWIFDRITVRGENRSKGKAIPLKAWTGLGGSRRLRLQDFQTVGHEGGKVVSPTYRPPLPPRKYSC